MNGEWSGAIPSLLVAWLLIIVPGLAVRLAGWPVRSVTMYFFVPALSTAVIAVSSNLAHVAGVRWSILPVLVVTAAAAGVAYLVRRWVGADDTTASSRWTIIAGAGGLVLAGAILIGQLTSAFVGPGNPSQTFDNIVHLNAIRLALDAGDASAMQIGATSDIAFYPNAWHSIVTLVAESTGVDAVTAVNAANVAIGALVWPASCLALAAVLFTERIGALIAAAALSTAFGAFPLLLLYFGVLYPNMMAYSLLPAGLAVVFLLLQPQRGRRRVQSAVLLAVVCAALGLAHPNAFLALFAMGTAAVGLTLLVSAIRDRSGRSVVALVVSGVVLLPIGAALWRFARTPVAMSRWGPWTDAAGALRDAVLSTPRGVPVSIVVVALTIAGIVGVIVRPSRAAIAAPFLVATLMFVLVSGTPVEFRLREWITNPWYNDSYRLAALLPIALIPLATFGALVMIDGAAALLRRVRAPRRLILGLGAGAAVVVFLVGFSPQVSASVAETRGAYLLDSRSPLLTVEELALIDRLDETVPGDAVIIGSPWTGVALAYALSGREVMERHVFGSRTESERYIDLHLRDIDTDPAVCAAVRAEGAFYVLDFGDRNMWSNPDVGTENSGVVNLPDSSHLVLVDSEGDAARLLRIEGC